MPPNFREIINGAWAGKRDRDGYVTHQWDSPSGGGTAQYWRPGEEAPTGRMPRNIYREYRREYRRGHEAGFHPGRFEGFRGGLERGFQEGHPRGWEDAYGMGYAGMEYGRGYGDIFPHAESWGYHDTYGVFDEWDQGGYGGGYGGYNRRYSY